MFFDELPKPIDESFAEEAFLGDGQAEIALWNSHLIVEGDAAETLEAGQRFESLPEILQMACSSYAVEDHANQADIRVELAITENHGGGAARHRRGVDDQNNRQAQLFRHLRRATFLCAAAPAVVKPHHALDDGDVFALGVVLKRAAIVIFRQHPTVKIV